MPKNIRSCFQLTCVLILAVSLTILFARHAATRGLEGEAWAIKGGTVVTVSGTTIPEGVVVIRNGLIVEVGANISIPGDARIVDATGMMIYPGLIDADTSYGLRPPATPAARGGGAPADPAQAFLARMMAPPSREGLEPEVMVADQLQINAQTFDQQRAAGITTAVTNLRTGIFRGQSVLLNLGAEEPEKLILKSPVSLGIGFSGARGGYPNSLMGTFAFLRQHFLDARHYREEWARYEKSPRGMTRPEVNKSLASLQPFINGEMPVVFDVSSVREIRRAISLAEEFNLKYLLSGCTQAYAVPELLRDKNATVLLSLSFPQKPLGLDDPESESLSVLRERAEAPKAAAALHKAGVRFAFTSGTLTRPQDYIRNAARAIEAGLPKDEALKALTIYPAQILGVAEQLGSLEKGKIANIILTSGDLFARETKIKHVFVDGQYFEIREAEQPRPAGGPLAGRGGGRGPGREAAPAAASAAGTWALKVNSPQGEMPGTLTLTQNGSSLSGELVTQLGTVPVTGKINGSEITFDYKINMQGQEIPVTATGKVDGNSLTGAMNAMGQSFDYTGSRNPR